MTEKSQEMMQLMDFFTISKRVSAETSASSFTTPSSPGKSSAVRSAAAPVRAVTTVSDVEEGDEWEDF